MGYQEEGTDPGLEKKEKVGKGKVLPESSRNAHHLRLSTSKQLNVMVSVPFEGRTCLTLWRQKL